MMDAREDDKMQVGAYDRIAKFHGKTILFPYHLELCYAPLREGEGFAQVIPDYKGIISVGSYCDVSKLVALSEDGLRGYEVEMQFMVSFERGKKKMQRKRAEFWAKKKLTRILRQCKKKGLISYK